MTNKDPRAGSSFYYQLSTPEFSDIDFYLEKVRDWKIKSILELGCGTGRVLKPLSEVCSKIVGVDHSQEYISVCERLNLKAPHRVVFGDITNLDLNEKFDLIIAPWRVMQALAEDRQLKGFFRTIKKHLAADGHGILNVFRPLKEREELIKTWVNLHESLSDEQHLADGTRIIQSDIRPKLQETPLVLFPELIWRRYDESTLIDEVRLPIKMRCFYPNEFIGLLESNGFRMLEKWGGYADEEYGVGSELVVHFKAT
jgi:SAM-dependent methyltransferase